jgi:hypothetical protein
LADDRVAQARSLLGQRGAFLRALRPQSRVIEECHGFAGALRTSRREAQTLFARRHSCRPRGPMAITAAAGLVPVDIFRETAGRVVGARSRLAPAAVCPSKGALQLRGPRTGRGQPSQFRSETEARNLVDRRAGAAQGRSTAPRRNLSEVRPALGSPPSPCRRMLASWCC